MDDNIKQQPTVYLVRELSQREGVEEIIVPPYEVRQITVEGPAIVLVVVD